MKKSLLLALLLAWTAFVSLRAQTPADKPVVKLDPSLDALISPDSKLELVKNDFGFTEGIGCVKRGNRENFLLSDMDATVLYKTTPGVKFSLQPASGGSPGSETGRVARPQPAANQKGSSFMAGSNGLALAIQ